jgi:hypothetical protein
MEGVGIRVWRMPSSVITMTSKRIRRSHLLRCYMVIGAEICWFGMRLENGRFLDPDILQEAERQVHMVRENLFRGQDRRAMMIIGGERVKL